MRAVGALVAIAAGVLALEATRAAQTASELGYAPWSAAGVAVLLIPGIAAMAVALESLRRRGLDRCALLLALAGAASLLPELGIAGARPALAFTAGLALGWAMPPLAAHLALVYPEQRLPAPERVVATAGYLAAIGLLGIGPALAFDPVGTGCGQCTDNLLRLRASPQLETSLGRVGVVASLAWAVLAIAAIAHRLARSTPASRRVAAPVSLAAVALLGSFAAALARNIGHGYLTTDATGRRLWLTGQLALLALALGVAARWARARRARTRLAHDVVELSSGARVDSVASRLARALGDPSLEIGYPVGTSGHLTDSGGTALAPLTPGRAETLLHDTTGQALAVARHRAGLLDDPALVDEITRTAGLALVNERLRVEARARLAELQASRARIVEAADAERRRLERDLHDGAQQRLVSLAVALRLAGDSPELEQARTELARALDELRTIARGLHPAVLSESGLAAAVHALAETAPVPLAVGELPAERLSPLAEATAYYLVAQATRDPRAERVAFSAATRDSVLSVSVLTAKAAADPTRLSDRVGAAGGTMRYRPAPDGRMELDVTLPCGS